MLTNLVSFLNVQFVKYLVIKLEEMSYIKRGIYSTNI